MGFKAIATVGLVPILARYFNPTETAIWAVFISLQGLQALIESAVTSVFVRIYAYAKGGSGSISRLAENKSYATTDEPNWTLFRRIEHTSVLLYTGIGIVTALFLFGVGAFAAVGRINELSQPEHGWIALIAIITMSGMRAYCGRYISALYGFEFITEQRISEAILWVICIAVTLMVVISTGSLAWTAIAYAATQISYSAVLVWQRRILIVEPDKEAGDLLASLQFDREIFRDIFGPLWRSSVGITLYLLAFQGTALDMARQLTPIEATTFLLTVNLSRYVTQFAQVPFLVVIPKLARLRSMGNLDDQRKVATRFMRTSFTLLMAMQIAIAILANPTMSAFGASDKAIDLNLWLIICVAMFFERHGGMHLQVYSTTNHIIWHWLNGGTGLILAAVAFLLQPHIGLYAWPISYLVSMALFYDPVSTVYSYKTLGFRFPALEIQTSLLPFAVSITVVATARYFGS